MPFSPEGSIAESSGCYFQMSLSSTLKILWNLCCADTKEVIFVGFTSGDWSIVDPYGHHSDLIGLTGVPGLVAWPDFTGLDGLPSWNDLTGLGYGGDKEDSEPWFLSEFRKELGTVAAFGAGTEVPGNLAWFAFWLAEKCISSWRENWNEIKEAGDEISMRLRMTFAHSSLQTSSDENKKRDKPSDAGVPSEDDTSGSGSAGNSKSGEEIGDTIIDFIAIARKFGEYVLEDKVFKSILNGVTVPWELTKETAFIESLRHSGNHPSARRFELVLEEHPEFDCQFAFLNWVWTTIVKSAEEEEAYSLIKWLDERLGKDPAGPEKSFTLPEVDGVRSVFAGGYFIYFEGTPELRLDFPRLGTT